MHYAHAKTFIAIKAAENGDARMKSGASIRAVLDADVPNCYTTLKVVICNKLSSDLVSTQ